MLCYMAIWKAPLIEGYSEALSAWQAGENKKSSNYEETQMISTVASHSGVQEEGRTHHRKGPIKG